MAKAVMQLETLTCPSCMKKIQGTLEKMDGVNRAKVLFNSSKAKVEFDESIVTEEDLKKIVEKLAYQVLDVKTA